MAKNPPTELEARADIRMDRATNVLGGERQGCLDPSSPFDVDTQGLEIHWYQCIILG